MDEGVHILFFFFQNVYQQHDACRDVVVFASLALHWAVHDVFAVFAYVPSVAPPRPPHLANPHALGDLEASADAPLRASARDARAWFDQLTLGDPLRPFTGRPELTIGELRSAAAELGNQLAVYI